MQTATTDMTSPAKQGRYTWQTDDRLRIEEPLQVPRMDVVERQDDQEVDNIRRHHLRGDIRRFWQAIWHILERWPDCDNDGIHTKSAVVCIDAVPEEANQHTDEYRNEGAEEAKG